jgi:cytochrome c2
MTRSGIAGWPVLVCSLLAAVCGSPPADAQPAGDAARGGELFAAKDCTRCHRPRGEAGAGPPLEEVRRPQGSFELAGRLWNHAPAMFATFGGEGVPWPRISQAEMADLMTYLQAAPGRDPAADPVRGEATLVRKGCLKCHRWRGEGGHIGPDLEQRRPVYDSAAAWAAAMWVHTPTMAAKARELGIFYPRFAEHELGNLVGYLKSVAR